MIYLALSIDGFENELIVKPEYFKISFNECCDYHTIEYNPPKEKTLINCYNERFIKELKDHCESDKHVLIFRYIDNDGIYKCFIRIQKCLKYSINFRILDIVDSNIEKSINYVRKN